MTNRMVYDREHSSLDFKDGIPDNPALAETYYSQFEGEFEDASPDKEEAEREEGEGSEEGEGTVEAHDEIADFINCLEGVNDLTSSENTVVADDTISGAYGPGAREVKIKNLRKQCIEHLGEQGFKKAYDYMRKARSGSGDKSEAEIMQGLRVYVKNPSDCFIVDQLLFLEDMSKPLS